jgi:hypothetical protein
LRRPSRVRAAGAHPRGDTGSGDATLIVVVP